MPRPDGRAADQLRPLSFDFDVPSLAAGKVLARLGNTVVLCTCCIEPKVPDFLVGSGKGWLTAEYNMLPGSTFPRKARERAKPDGRSVEIQRLIGRSLRTIVNLDRLGERTLWIDCDVLQADGGTRVTSISGAYLALRMAWQRTPALAALPWSEVVRDTVAAVSVGLSGGLPILDLNYLEDRDADVDMNLVMTGTGQLIEIQAGGEEATFTPDQFAQLLALGQQGIAAITAAQKDALARLRSLPSEV